ncbi:hypothetical protein PSTT_06413 [Puccinia striiformis]|uniref:Uncharacterized protein n=1 Tax=Puccinia striiformis TaxID=27350 RepID=A0A2S4VKF1_9BASI|nr:hypothetical protein PSTT_06413 [Puccinia striiformis]
MRPSMMSGKVIVALLCWVTRPVDTTEEVINPFSRPKLVGIQSIRRELSVISSKAVSLTLVLVWVSHVQDQQHVWHLTFATVPALIEPISSIHHHAFIKFCKACVHSIDRRGHYFSPARWLALFSCRPTPPTDPAGPPPPEREPKPLVAPAPMPGTPGAGKKTGPAPPAPNPADPGRDAKPEGAPGPKPDGPPGTPGPKPDGPGKDGPTPPLDPAAPGPAPGPGVPPPSGPMTPGKKDGLTPPPSGAPVPPPGKGGRPEKESGPPGAAPPSPPPGATVPAPDKKAGPADDPAHKKMEPKKPDGPRPPSGGDGKKKGDERSSASSLSGSVFTSGLLVTLTGIASILA